MKPARLPALASRALLALALISVLVGGLLTMRARQEADAARAAIARGRYDFATGSCISCHTLDGISYAAGAADLTHEGSRRAYAWLQHEIRFPTSLRPPTPPGQEDDLVAFLSSLK